MMESYVERLTSEGDKETFGNQKNVLYLDCSDLCMEYRSSKSHQILYFKIYVVYYTFIAV